MKKEILRQLRSDYEKIEIKPSRDLWDRIDHALEETADLPLKRPVQWWKYAAVVLLLISSGVYFYFDSKPAESDVIITKSGKRNKISTKELNGAEFNNSEVKETHHGSIVISDKRNVGEIKSEKAIIKTYQDNSKSNTALVKEEKNMHIENIVNIPIAEEKTHDQIAEKPIIVAEKKKASYIKADDLLLGREIDKTREENHGGQKKIGVVDMEKIKIKGPNSLKILGMTVFSDSSETK